MLNQFHSPTHLGTTVNQPTTKSSLLSSDRPQGSGFFSTLIHCNTYPDCVSRASSHAIDASHFSYFRVHCCLATPRTFHVAAICPTDACLHLDDFYEFVLSFQLASLCLWHGLFFVCLFASVSAHVAARFHVMSVNSKSMWENRM